MKITAEVRDMKKLRRMVTGLVTAFALYLIALTGSIIGAAYYRGGFTVAALILIVLLIPVIIIGAVTAARGYNNSWMTEEYELIARDEGIYYKGRKLHVNYNEKNDVIYVHDLGDYGDYTKAEIYLTVFGEDKDKLLDYIRVSGVKIEDEILVSGVGKYSMVNSMNLNVSKYRRR